MDAIGECPDCQADKKKKALAKKRRLRATEIRVTVARLTEENERYWKALEQIKAYPTDGKWHDAAVFGMAGIADAALAKREEQA